MGRELVCLREHGEVKGGTKEEGEKKCVSGYCTVKPLFVVTCEAP